MMDFSLLIIVKNRRTHVQNILRALPASTCRPNETIVVHMNEAAYGLNGVEGLREVSIRTDDSLPLAQARNRAARESASGRLVFLDADCIPDSRCFETLLTDLDSWELSMADPRYLSGSVSGTKAIDFSALDGASSANPARESLAYGPCKTYEMFWSLGFAITKRNFETIGGFDAGYQGYGGEDTDFAFAARRSGVSFGMSRGRVFHQDHPSYDPPLNWLPDIVANAKRFHTNWGVWPMEGWLRRFAELSYISWDNDGSDLTLLKLPTEAEIEMYRKVSSAPAG